MAGVIWLKNHQDINLKKSPSSPPRRCPIAQIDRDIRKVVKIEAKNWAPKLPKKDIPKDNEIVKIVRESLKTSSSRRILSSRESMQWRQIYSAGGNIRN